MTSTSDSWQKTAAAIVEGGDVLRLRVAELAVDNGLPADIADVGERDDDPFAPEPPPRGLVADHGFAEDPDGEYADDDGVMECARCRFPASVHAWMAGSDPPPWWQITDDAHADYALRKLARVRAEEARLKSRFVEERAMLDVRESRVMAPVKAKEAELLGALVDYHRRVRPDGRKYPLAFGDLVSRAGTDVVEVDNEQLLRDMLEAYDRMDLLNVKITPAIVPLRQAVRTGVAAVAAVAMLGSLGRWWPDVPAELPGARVVRRPRSWDARPTPVPE